MFPTTNILTQCGYMQLNQVNDEHQVWNGKGWVPSQMVKVSNQRIQKYQVQTNYYMKHWLKGSIISIVSTPKVLIPSGYEYYREDQRVVATNILTSLTHQHLLQTMDVLENIDELSLYFQKGGAIYEGVYLEF
jgi:hypothetical protein